MRAHRLLFAVAACVALVLGGSLASADPGGAQRAIVTLNGGAWLPGSISGLDCDLNPSDVSGFQRVVTQKGTAILVVSFNIPEDCIPSHTLRNDGFLAGVAGQLTTDTRCLANKGGKAFLNVKAPD